MKRIYLLVALSLVAFAPSARAANVHPAKERPGAVSYDHALGRRVYHEACAKCHEKGVAGAPKIGDRQAWVSRLAQGTPTLIRHAIDGFMCNRGVLPPRGGDPALTDREIGAATHYLIDKSR